MNQPDPAEPKLVVDDDWKARVEREKTEPVASQSSPPGPDGDVALESTFELLVTTLSMQAMSAMGLLRDPSQPAHVDLEMARHFIDLLGVLEEKTQGNLSADEADMLHQTLHHLRLFFVSPEVQQSSVSAPPGKPTGKSSIELP